ncbi:MAG: glycosyl hydrolase [Proteobacteria bacterium]|nr:glycosyl hydrolase [Pseudomonadota bacterium]
MKPECHARWLQPATGIARLVVAVLLVTAALAVRAQPALFHDHGHGLSFSSDGKALLAPSHGGLAVYEGGAWREAAGPIQGFSGFSVAEHAIYASGHSRAGVPSAHEPIGLVRSTDGGRSWQPIAPGLAGGADFPLLAAGYRSKAIYVVNARPNPAMPTPGIYLTRDEGLSWLRATARNLEGEIHGLAAHPRETGTVAVATGRGLYLSRDSGGSFVLVDGKEPATAVAFDFGGQRVRYARTVSNQVVESTLDGRGRKALRLPRLRLDYVTCLAQNPKDERVLAFATRRRDVYVTNDGGISWRRIASEESRRVNPRREKDDQ